MQQLTRSISARQLTQAVSTAPKTSTLIILIWAIGGAIDTGSTITMTGNGYHEGNPAALIGMSALGVAGYSYLAYGIGLALAALGAATTRTLYGATIRYTLLGLGIGKLYVALNNAWILNAQAPFPGLG